MKYAGNLKKMKSRLAEPVEYTLELNDALINMNELIGHKVRLHFTGQINCKVCGRLTKKSFAQGFCYPCFLKAPENSECIIKPELCRAHLGEGRDPEWEKENHLQPHIVYLALSSDVKIGVTRKDQVPTRWIDQGAWKAIPLAEVPYRYLAGVLEVEMKQHMTDKTNWQRMLKNMVADNVVLEDEKEKIKELVPQEHQQYLTDDSLVTEIHYPVEKYPTKVKAINLDKDPDYEGTLTGIKGQYLIFEGGQVINIRKYTGYFIEMETN
jgi:hypothetical protein